MAGLNSILKKFGSEKFQNFLNMIGAFDIIEDLYDNAFFINDKGCARHCQDPAPGNFSGLKNAVKLAELHILIA